MRLTEFNRLFETVNGTHGPTLNYRNNLICWKTFTTLNLQSATAGTLIAHFCERSTNSFVLRREILLYWLLQMLRLLIIFNTSFLDPARSEYHDLRTIAGIVS